MTQQITWMGYHLNYMTLVSEDQHQLRCVYIVYTGMCMYMYVYVYVYVYVGSVAMTFAMYEL